MQCIKDFTNRDDYYIDENGNIFKIYNNDMNVSKQIKTRLNKLNNRIYLFLLSPRLSLEIAKLVYYYFVSKDVNLDNVMIDYKDGDINNLNFNNLVAINFEEYLQKKYNNRWKEINDDKFKGYYICTDGRIWSKITYNLLNVYTNKNSKLVSVKIKIKQKLYSQYLHILVAKTFIENEYNRKYVRHISTDFNDNSINNLRWDNSKLSYNEERKKNLSNSKSKERDGGIYIEGYDEKYIIYENGDVYNRKSRKLLKHIKTNMSFMAVSLRKDGENKMFLVHRLVAQYFILRKKYDLDEVTHIDGDLENNHKDNLMWIKNTKVINTIDRRNYIKQNYGKRIVKINKNTNKLVERYECLSKTGLDEEKQYIVSQVLNKEREMYIVYVWKFEEDYEREKKEERINKSKIRNQQKEVKNE